MWKSSDSRETIIFGDELMLVVGAPIEAGAAQDAHVDLFGVGWNASRLSARWASEAEKASQALTGGQPSLAEGRRC